jgi:hypothetical protein
MFDRPSTRLVNIFVSLLIREGKGEEGEGDNNNNE